MTSESDSGVEVLQTDNDQLPSAGSSSDVFELDYRTFLQKQIKTVVDAEKAKRNLDKLDELSISIDLCKNLLLEIGDRDERKAAQVLDMMVDLKLQFAQLKENLMNGLSAESTVNINGHELVRQTSAGSNPYCEICMSTIWRFAESYLRCTRCRLKVHGRCTSDIKLPCAMSIVSQPGFQFELQICPETSLPVQNYKCYDCHSEISFDEGSAYEPRLCDYSGHYYCRKCHWKDEMVIPARILHNWDFTPRQVSRSSKKLLMVGMKRPIIEIEKLSPMLVQLVNGISELCKMRKQILFMKCYFMSCKWAKNLRILQYLNRYQHFVEGSDLYTLDDLIQLGSGNLIQDLKEIIGVFTKHITEECETCKGHAFICELCTNKEFLFPFNEHISICRECCAVFHEPCFSRVSKRCPKCARRRARKISSLVENDES